MTDLGCPLVARSRALLAWRMNLASALVDSVFGSTFSIPFPWAAAGCFLSGKQKVMAKGNSIKNVGKKMGLMKAKTAQHAELNGDPFSV